MHFRLEQRLHAPLASVERAYAEPSFYEVVKGTATLSAPILLDRSERPEGVDASFRMGFIGELPGAARAFVQPDKLTWVTSTTLHPAEHRLEFSMKPDFYQGLLTCQGAYEFSEVEPDVEGDVTPAGTGPTQRVISGDLSIGVPIVGASVERAVVTGLEQYLEVERVAMERWAAPR
jgi:Protein of unknown function (DUF2505)